MRVSRPGLSLPAALVFVASVVMVAPTQGDPPASVTYTYDDAARLKSGTFSDGKVVGYEYDPAGNRTAMTQGVPVQLSIAPASATEGSNVVLTVTKAGTATGTVTVECAQSNGTALSGSDFTASLQVLTFLIADTSKSCIVATLPDSLYEQAQTFNAFLQNPTGSAVLDAASAIATINDDDPAPVFTVANAATTEGTGLLFTITKTGSTELSHGISYSTANGTATTADSDYTALSSSYTFAAAEASLPITVSTTADSKYELNETLTLTLASPTKWGHAGFAVAGHGHDQQ